MRNVGGSCRVYHQSAFVITVPETVFLSLGDFQEKANLSSKDAIHVACAYHVKCNYFVTCDDVLIKRAKRLKLDVKVMNPVII